MLKPVFCGIKKAAFAKAAAILTQYFVNIPNCFVILQFFL